MKQIAADLGITGVALSTWLRAAGIAVRGGPRRTCPMALGVRKTPAQELARLRRENADLRAAKDLRATERDILRRAAEYFAGETRW